ncbi:hypothetical protein FRX31_004838 [Thalictrum thalictroides]|uniref:Uncharacterized protein n=1 Tax=Thalictrum thalictroides TaxID=46969 RepID=A0A7J6X9V3_THATH|nr:hypothetical protein FRX31_004838 [Thalictrum thalictroides]
MAWSDGEGRSKVASIRGVATNKNEIDDPYGVILSAAAAHEIGGICERHILGIRAGPQSARAWGIGLSLLHWAATTLDQKEKQLKDQTTSSAGVHTPEL